MNEAGNKARSVTVELPMTLSGLIEAYKTHKASSYHKLRYHVRQNHDGILRRLNDQYGATALSDVRASTIQIWHNGWVDGGKIATAHSFISQLRTMFGFGLLFLEERECERLCVILSKMKFPQSKPQTESMLPGQADAIRTQARRHGWRSIALAQAFAFEMVLRQKDCIGEWVPLSEPGLSDVISRKKGKWFRGLRWEEIDENLILRHITSKIQKPIEGDLAIAPMIVEELELIAPGTVVVQEIVHPITQAVTKKIIINRSLLPAHGPVIICETSGHPYTAAEFRRKWRIVADLARVPKSVKSMHSRSGGISEMFRAGVRPDAAQLSAAHSDVSMTMHYNRQNHLETRSEGQLLRVEHRNRATQ